MSKYGQSIGIWDLKVARDESQGALALHPTHKDNRKLLSIVMNEKYKTNPELLLDGISRFVQELIAREYPPSNDEEKKDLEAYVDSNLIELMNETLIAFRLAKREDLETQRQIAKKGLLQTGLSPVMS